MHIAPNVFLGTSKEKLFNPSINLLMFDINFFQKVLPHKEKIVAGHFCLSDADSIERELDALRIRKPKVFNVLWVFDIFI